MPLTENLPEHEHTREQYAELRRGGHRQRRGQRTEGGESRAQRRPDDRDTGSRADGEPEADRAHEQRIDEEQNDDRGSEQPWWFSLATDGEGEVPPVPPSCRPAAPTARPW